MVSHEKISYYRNERKAHGHPINLILEITQEGILGVGRGKEKLLIVPSKFDIWVALYKVVYR